MEGLIPRKWSDGKGQRLTTSYYIGKVVVQYRRNLDNKRWRDSHKSKVKIK
jgi:hypothetical protein